MKYKKKLKRAYSPHYAEKKSLFSEKEIIFRSSGKARAVKISSRSQLIGTVVLILLAIWGAHAYHIYHKSDRIIYKKDMELVRAKNAYEDLMGDFMAIQRNIDEVLSSSKNKEIETYKKKAMIVEDKIKQISSSKGWNEKTVNEKADINEALLQRDLAAAERDALKEQLAEMEDAVQNIKKAELEVFKKVEAIASKEVDKIKSAFSQANGALKAQGVYFNPLANSGKRDSKGGLFEKDSSIELRDKEIIERISNIYKAVDDVEYYREVAKAVPFGKPVWSYWVSSKFGARSDPFNRKVTGHKGVDLAARMGNKIRIMAKGRVIKTEHSNKGYGNLVVVDHGNGFKTKYAHLSKIYVKEGDNLNINDAVGEVGSTGRSTGPHLHYEVLYQGKPVDPMPFIQAKLS
ncbi:MAG: peptidoglycan DD-metalloendopeptidase family protein [Alphaproteobacteria bacterium]|nr:peptidoglycan DD-metalloendopeptidase family protein [Alphaproteobacteria bacterium]MBQ9234907.1 peptidoglycan DD-metalloendopeptidase family protein [Alphaproteobacteria bacterium]